MNKLTSLVEKAIVLMFALINTLYHNLALAVSPSYRSRFNRKLFLEEQKTIQDKLLRMKVNSKLLRKCLWHSVSLQKQQYLIMILT